MTSPNSAGPKPEEYPVQPVPMPARPQERPGIPEPPEAPYQPEAQPEMPTEIPSPTPDQGGWTS